MVFPEDVELKRKRIERRRVGMAWEMHAESAKKYCVTRSNVGRVLEEGAFGQNQGPV